MANQPATEVEKPTIEDLVHGFASLHAPACKISQQAIADGLMLLVENAIKLDRARLADQAEREANEIKVAASMLREDPNMRLVREYEGIAAWIRKQGQ